MDIPFEVGKKYRNRNGVYEVLAIEEPKMRVRFEDGSETNLDIALQALIGSMWENVPVPEPPVVPKDAGKKVKRRGRKKAPADSKQEKLIAEILKDDKAIYEILTRLTIPPGQLDLYRLFLNNPDDYFSQQEIADAVKGSDSKSGRGVFMAFGRRIGASPDERVQSLKPYNSLFFHRKSSDGKTLLQIRPRVIEIFKSYPKFYDFLINDSRRWLPDEFGTEQWENTPEVQQQQMAYFELLDDDQGSEETAVD